jgi:hypothetical protein
MKTTASILSILIDSNNYHLLIDNIYYYTLYIYIFIHSRHFILFFLFATNSYKHSMSKFILKRSLITFFILLQWHVSLKLFHCSVEKVVRVLQLLSRTHFYTTYAFLCLHCIEYNIYNKIKKNAISTNYRFHSLEKEKQTNKFYILKRFYILRIQIIILSSLT